MGRKYLCDNCGDEVEGPEHLTSVDAMPVRSHDDDDLIELGEFCKACFATVKRYIKDGFQKSEKT